LRFQQQIYVVINFTFCNALHISLWPNLTYNRPWSTLWNHNLTDCACHIFHGISVWSYSMKFLQQKWTLQYSLDIPSIYFLLMLPSSAVFLTIIEYKYYYMICTRCFITSEVYTCCHSQLEVLYAHGSDSCWMPSYDYLKLRNDLHITKLTSLLQEHSHVSLNICA